MADSFKGYDLITLQPNDATVPYSFLFTICSASTKNDGAIPYGMTISSCSVTAHTEAGTVCTTELIAASSLNSMTETVWLDYPSVTGAGRYHLTFVTVLSDTSIVLELDFNRIIAKNI